jgi:hypothetical protein
MLPYRAFIVVCATLLLNVFSPLRLSAQTTALQLKSQPGDSVGGGTDQTFTPAEGTFTARPNFANGVDIFFDGGPHWWQLSFAAPGNVALVPGVYDGATRFPFQSPTAPGMSVSGEGRGCNTLTGRFEVLEAIYSSSGGVDRFAATFEQHCEGGVPALLGSVLINSTLPPPPPPPTHCISSVATINALSGEVGQLTTSDRTLYALQYFLSSAQWGFESGRPRFARSSVAEFISRVVHASNLGSDNPNAIPEANAVRLVCGASNMLTNISIQR